MRVLLPGGSGFLGRAVHDQLRYAGHEVITAGRSSTADVKFDIRESSQEDVGLLIESTDPEVIINLAGSGLSDSTAKFAQLLEVNCVWPRQLANEVVRRKNVRLLHVGSSTESPQDSRGKFESQYSASKAAGTGELKAARDGAPNRLGVVFLHNTYGPQQPGGRLVRWLIEAASTDSRVQLKYPRRVRDFIYVDDAARSIALAVNDPSAAHGMEIGTGIGTSLAELAALVYTKVGAEVRLIESLEAPSPDPFIHRTALPDRLFVPSTTPLAAGLDRTIKNLSAT